MPTRDEMMRGDDAPTYRQLDHWTSRGYLRTVANSTPGSGHLREWCDGEDRIAQLMIRLLRTGVVLEKAHEVARAGRSTCGNVCHADPVTGVTIYVEER